MVLGGQPLDKLQHWVTDLFSAVPSGKGPRPTFFDAGMPYKVCFLHFGSHLAGGYLSLIASFVPVMPAEAEEA